MIALCAHCKCDLIPEYPPFTFMLDEKHPGKLCPDCYHQLMIILREYLGVTVQ